MNRQPLSPDQIRTALGMLAIFLLIVGCDGWLYWAHGHEATVSATARALAERWPAFQVAVCLGAGLLLGHLFLGQ